MRSANFIFKHFQICPLASTEIKINFNVVLRLLQPSNFDIHDLLTLLNEMSTNRFRGLIPWLQCGKVVIVAKRLETTNGIGPEAELFTFSKMAAGMYLEHYLDSKMVIPWGGVYRGNNDCPPYMKLLSHMMYFSLLDGCMLIGLP